MVAPICAPIAESWACQRLSAQCARRRQCLPTRCSCGKAVQHKMAPVRGNWPVPAGWCEHVDVYSIQFIRAHHSGHLSRPCQGAGATRNGRRVVCCQSAEGESRAQGLAPVCVQTRQISPKKFTASRATSYNTHWNLKSPLEASGALRSPRCGQILLRSSACDP